MRLHFGYMYGWSYGGFMTLYSATHAPGLIRAAISGAPVTDFRNYDTIYTERCERWATRAGPVHHPYVRSLGGVSLFDFRSFDRERYSQNFPLSDWAEFVPFRSIWQSSVWIEIDAVALGAAFISGADLLNRWKADRAHNHRLLLSRPNRLPPRSDRHRHRRLGWTFSVSPLGPVQLVDCAL